MVPRWLAALGALTLPLWRIGQTEVLHAVVPALPVIALIPFAFMAWEAWLAALALTFLVAAWRGWPQADQPARQTPHHGRHAARRWSFEPFNLRLGDCNMSRTTRHRWTAVLCTALSTTMVTTLVAVLADPVLTGPTLHGFVLQHWDTLAAGQVQAVRMVALVDMTTYGFESRSLPAADGLVSFSVIPSSLLVRLAIAPLKLSFDAGTRALVRYEGRVPPMRTEGSTLKALDARVEYRMDLARYQ